MRRSTTYPHRRQIREPRYGGFSSRSRSLGEGRRLFLMGPSHLASAIESRQERGAQVTPGNSQGFKAQGFYDFEQRAGPFGATGTCIQKYELPAVNPTTSTGTFWRLAERFRSDLHSCSSEDCRHFVQEAPLVHRPKYEAVRWKPRAVLEPPSYLAVAGGGSAPRRGHFPGAARINDARGAFGLLASGPLPLTERFS